MSDALINYDIERCKEILGDLEKILEPVEEEVVSEVELKGKGCVIDEIQNLQAVYDTIDEQFIELVNQTIEFLDDAIKIMEEAEAQVVKSYVGEE